MISAVILTKNSQETLAKTLDSLQNVSEVILLDTGSTDSTPKIAERYPNVKIFHSPFVGFGRLRNLGASYARHDWILAIDSDEMLSEPLKHELHGLELKTSCVYAFPFHNFYRGKQVKCCGWHPESHIRLYCRLETAFKEAEVHEGVETKDFKVVSLRHPVHHYPYRNIDDFLRKMQHYTSLFARQYRHQKKSSFKKALFHGAFAFFKSYLWKRGIFYGAAGFEISCYNASCAFYKYLKLAEETSKCS